MKFNIYSMWMDYTFYIYLFLLIAAFTFFLFAIRRIMEINESEEETEASGEDFIAETPSSISNEPSAAVQTELPPQENLFPEEKPPEVNAASKETLSPAEEFIKNLYVSISRIDDRMKNIEKNIGVPKEARKDFTVKFLEDILGDYENLDKEKIKARIEFLVSDLKK